MAVNHAPRHGETAHQELTEAIVLIFDMREPARALSRVPPTATRRK